MNGLIRDCSIPQENGIGNQKLDVHSSALPALARPERYMLK
jgi:hypothetical protein